jgi:hypothetical protein
MDKKQHVNKKRQVEINNPASSGVQGKCVKYISFCLSPLEVALSVFNLSLLV